MDGISLRARISRWAEEALLPANRNVALFDRELERNPPSKQILRTRISQALHHQNKIRKKQNLSPLDVNVESIPIEPCRRNPKYFDIELFQNSKVVDHFIAAGDLVVRPRWGDAHALNHAYLFEGDSLKSSMSLSDYVLDCLEGDKVLLVRNMGNREFAAWQRNDWLELQKHSVSWGRDSAVLHFELNKRPWIGSYRPQSLVFDLSKASLQKWSEEGSLSMGITSVLFEGSRPILDIEVVISSERWGDLLNSSPKPCNMKMGIGKKLFALAADRYTRKRLSPLRSSTSSPR